MIDFKRHIALSIEEDIREEDHSAAACIPVEAESRAHLLVKDNGILSGVEIAKMVFETIDSNLIFDKNLEDGTTVSVGDIAFTVSGSARSLLKAERLALNYMQRMSGIATSTSEYVDLIKHTKTKVLDTRKTSPGLRSFEKLAVVHGGGVNHRYGLYDMIMIKDNHIDYAGSIEAAMTATQNYLQKNNLTLKIEVEARDLTEVERILKHGVADRIMFDNFNYSDTKEGVALVASKMETESSGGINLDTIKGYAECGVDFISVGALTHQIHSLDMSLKAY
jgi:nicotinate-nucleotide pyrophosphorylase (carboxylating)